MFLENFLRTSGHEVFIDRRMLVGTKWADEIDRQIRAAEFFVVLLSAESILSELVRQEVKLAHELEKQNKLTILPIRVAFFGALPYDLAAYLDKIQYALWNEGEAFETIASQILAAMEKFAALPHQAPTDEVASAEAVQSLFAATDAIGAPLPQADPRLVPQLALETGTMQLESPFYIQRASDAAMQQQIRRRGDTTVVKGTRQMGKSSLLARAFAMAQQQQHKAFYFDLQFLEAEHLESLERLLLHLGRKLSRAFKTAIKPEVFWDAALGAKDNLTDFLAEAILAPAEAPVLLMFDEIDRLFNYPYRDDFFATLRGWHNLRATSAPWRRFNLMIAHSTEPYLWIQDLNQSPFNVGHIIRLEDFNFAEAEALNAKHGAPITTPEEITELLNFLGGQPFLLRQAFYMLAQNRWTLAQLQNAAISETGPFGDHLRRFVWRLQERPELKNALREILHKGRCDDETHFLRLKAAGLINGENRQSVHMRCQLYEQYFKNHL